MTEEGIARIRILSLGFTGVCCAAYAIAVLVTGRPDPVAWWWPGFAGVISLGLITAAAVMGGKRAAEAATDELYRAVNHRAERHAYWVSMVLFAVIAILCVQGFAPWHAGFAALGCLMGAAYLLLFVWYDLRMR